MHHGPFEIIQIPIPNGPWCYFPGQLSAARGVASAQYGEGWLKITAKLVILPPRMPK